MFCCTLQRSKDKKNLAKNVHCEPLFFYKVTHFALFRIKNLAENRFLTVLAAVSQDTF